MNRLIALTLCVMVLAGAASFRGTAKRPTTPTASAGKSAVTVAAKTRRSGYIVASS